MDQSNPIFFKLAIIFACLFAIKCIMDIILKMENNNSKSDNTKSSETLSTINDYYRSDLLTKNEWRFYCNVLRPFAKKYNLHILSKVRMEDLIKAKDDLDNKKKMSARGRIRNKHFDFVIADQKNLRIYMVIELDDNSHNEIERQQSDKFVNDLCKSVGLPILRTTGNENIENTLCEMLNIEVIA